MAYFKKNNKYLLESNLISYVIPIWEKSSSQEIEFSINSLLEENHLINEIIIVFDGFKSFNLGFKIPKEFKEKLKYIYCGINRGPGVARNKGVLFSKSKYIFFLDCGDKSVKNRIQTQLISLKNNDVCFGDIREVFPSGKEVIRRGATSYQKAKRLIAFRNPFNNVTMGIKKSSFLELGGYANLRIGEDWVLMGKIIKKELRISFLEKELVKVFTGNDFLQRRSGKKYFIEIKKCLKIILKLKLMNRVTYLFSLINLFLLRSFIPKKILSLIYRFLRN